MKTGLIEDGTEEVEVITLDSALKEKKVTFIKMDIEGADLSALRGAKEIILTQKPMLTISMRPFYTQ